MVQWCKHLAPINVAILLERAAREGGGGGVVRGYLHNQIRAGGNVARVQIPTSTPYII